jgi:uncharacterized protein
MYYSKYNILSKIKDSGKHFIVNLLSGNADILDNDDASLLLAAKDNEIKFTPELIDYIDKGYITDPAEESRLYRAKYLDFIDSRDEDEIQVFFVPNYSCNFACSYCYQDEYVNPHSEVTREVIDSFFQYISREFAGRKKYITVFGGEPFLNTAKQKETISYIIDKANQSGLELSFVTNGYYLSDYMDILKAGKIREIQVTLDGTEQVHNGRRFLKGGKGTFNQIVDGIDACLDNGITINLRLVADRENIDNLPALARFAIDKGWTKSGLFKTQIGRNYELHHCQSAPDKLFSRISLYEKIYELCKEHPHITEFYKPAYSVSKFLFENEELPAPLFDSCPACKTEWAFDYTGNIYSCTATVGKPDESLGTFHPSVVRREDVIEQWQSRDVTEIEDCKSCSLQLACGGGCGSVAKNSTGHILSTDCRPVKELLELGFAAYSGNWQQATEN